MAEQVNPSVPIIQQRQPVVGDVLSGATESGSEPVKVGAPFRATKPTIADGQRGEFQITQHGALLVARAIPDSGWQQNNNPAANTQATTSQPAGGAGVHHVCTWIAASLTAGSTAPTVPATPVNVRLRDGASGAGTVIWLCGLAIPATAGESDKILLSGLEIVGSANTAMTLEFSAAGGAGTFEIVAFGGYDITF